MSTCFDHYVHLQATKAHKINPLPANMENFVSSE